MSIKLKNTSEPLTVFAVVVTFNRAEMLKSCISSLLKQKGRSLSRIHIIVNSDDAQTVEVIELFKSTTEIITYRHYDNPGPAGGFHHGLQQFLSEDCDYVWLMDDDVVVTEDCLFEMMKHTDKHSYVFPRVIKGDGEDVVSFGWWGVLLRRDLVEKAGLPIPEFFFWQEDTEYLQNRLTQVHNTTPYRCKTAVVNHLHLRKKKYPSWYYYYIIRNTLYYRKYVVGYNWRRFHRTIYLYVHSCAMILVKEDNKLKKLKLVIEGTQDGLKGRIGKLKDPSLNK
jgi:GT2 family glycosyltransferase